MSNSTIDSANGGAPETAAAPAKAKREHKAKKSKPAKKTGRTKAAGKPKAAGNEKAEVIAMMKRAKGAVALERRFYPRAFAP